MSVESCSPVGSDELDVSSGDEHSISESMDNESNPAAVTSPLDKVPCQICRLQTSAVIYFNVPVCSGCRYGFESFLPQICQKREKLSMFKQSFVWKEPFSKDI
ncbi:hypothetical protein M3Y97_01026000 [Aphelenchoides bicaudatus]|nr:hypothetical protein M3Y97_01026000 [Aphelenchoides bicaudatus]